MNSRRNPFLAELQLTPVDAFNTNEDRNLLLVAALGKEPYHLAEVGHLADLGAHPNVRSRNGWTPLYCAVNKNNLAMVECLLHAFRDDPRFLEGIDLPNTVGGTPLMVASQMGSVPLVRFLLENGADPNRQDVVGYSALLRAADHCTGFTANNNPDPDYLGVCRLLLTHGANPDIDLWTGRATGLFTTLMAAAKRGAADILELLFEHHRNNQNNNDKPLVSLEAKDGNGRTALYLATAAGHTSAVAMLLKHGADPLTATTQDLGFSKKKHPYQPQDPVVEQSVRRYRLVVRHIVAAAAAKEKAREKGEEQEKGRGMCFVSGNL